MFTENQVRQFYVLGEGKAEDFTTHADAAAAIAGGSTSTIVVDNSSDTGTMQFVAGDDEAYFLYKGPSDDGVQRTDLIKKCNVVDVRVTDARDLVHENKKAVITLDSSLLDSTNLAITGDYVLNVSIHNYIALDYNTTKIKFGAVRGVAGTSASDFYKKMALSLAKNFVREGAPLVNIYITKTNATGNTSNNVAVTGKEASISAISGIAVGIVIEEAEQPWRLGAAPQEFVNFTVNPSTVYDSENNIDIVWGKVQFYGSATYTDGTASAVTVAAGGTQPNSKKVADMEWFFHKERGDKYGEMCWPWNIDTEYQVNPNNDDGYSIVDIHYYFEGNSHNVGHSEKTLTIVGDADDLEDLIGTPYVPASGSGQDATPAADATGLFAFLDGSNATIKFSKSWGS